MKRSVLALLCFGSLLLFSGCASAEKSKFSPPPSSQRVELGEADTAPGRTDGEREEIWDDYNKVMKDSEQTR